MIHIQKEDFNVEQVINQLKQPGIGVIVTFSGVVRGTSRDGRVVTAVEWDVYKEMALKLFEEIRQKAIQKFGINDASIIHRFGRQETGENLVLIATASPHRREAFEACEYIMNEIKKSAPLWKKEILQDGEERWIGE